MQAAMRGSSRSSRWPGRRLLTVAATSPSPRHPSTVDGKDLPPSRHVGVLSTNTLVGPGKLYGDTVPGYAPSRRMEVGVDTYASGGSSPTHRHADREKLFVVLEGQARIWVG